MDRVLTKVIDYLVSAKHVDWAINRVDGLSRVNDVPGRSQLYDVFSAIEPWQNNHFQFDRLDHAIPLYAMAAKLGITNHVSLQHVALLIVRELNVEIRNGNTVCFGFTGDFSSAVRAFCGVQVDCPKVHWPLIIINGLLTLLIVCISMSWIAVHLRLRSPSIREYFLGGDFIGDERDCRLYRELEDGGPAFMLKRGLGLYSPLRNELSGSTF